MSSHPEKNSQAPDSWRSLRQFTSARIALGRTGQSVPLKESLHFKLTHAHARDAVYSSLNINVLEQSLQKFGLPLIHLHSKATSREEYLQRPDSGRRLRNPLALSGYNGSYDLCIIVADGLSARAIEDHVVSLLDNLIPSVNHLRLAPLTIAEQARVAIGDEIGSLFNSKLSLILIGERPGLSSPNSLGAYLTYSPAIGLTDESRNCVSNIRPEGLPYTEAATKILYLIQQSLHRKISGVRLKDESGLLGQ